MVFYVVRKGFKTGIYDTWDECKRHVDGYSGAMYKKFRTIEEARYYYDTGKIMEDSGTIIMTSNGKVRSISSLSSINNKEKEKEKEKEIEKPERDNRKGYLEVWTDGSCLANGRRGSVGGVGVFFGDNDLRNISDSLSTQDIPHTNQKAELRAISLALKVLLRDGDKEKNKKIHVTIYTDSMYSINCIDKWAENWEKNGWKTVGGQKVKNLELIQRAVRRYKKVKKMYKSLKFRHINSHMRAPNDKKSKEYEVWYGNEQADKLAKLGAVKG